MRDAIAEVIINHSDRRNMNIYSYSTKLLRDNFITYLFFHEFLNYESSSMRNDYSYLEDNARYRFRFVIIIIKKKRLSG